ncbi:MAG: hypothetical protein EZS28_023265 [Streblomastix strix]|uniref:Uncharacterized protein n=1 Tax=Streblomastix strix TaxID=222440 RepID=A0A5J4VFN4_9EUKA|nr:MAG: hypothetical protein EZS28_023265 [Streblomastix strix]
MMMRNQKIASNLATSLRSRKVKLKIRRTAQSKPDSDGSIADLSEARGISQQCFALLREYRLRRQLEILVGI